MDWVNGLELLSLDFVRPVFAELGVGVECEETLRGAARDALMGRYSGQNEPFRLDSWGDPSTTYSVWIVPFLSAMERVGGAADRHRIERWVRYVVCMGSRNPWEVYESVLSSWASALRRTGTDRIGFSADPKVIESELMSVTDIRIPEDLMTKRTARFLTDWDFPRFVARGLLEIPDGSEFFPFVDQILLAIRMNRFQRFWSWMITFTDPSDVQRIADVAREVYGKRGTPYCPPGQLELPY